MRRQHCSRAHQAVCAKVADSVQGCFVLPPHGDMVVALDGTSRAASLLSSLLFRLQVSGSAPSELATERSKLDQAPGYTEFHAAVGRPVPSGRSSAGPTPTQEINLLAELAQAGAPVHQLLDDIALSRAWASLAGHPAFLTLRMSG